MLCISLPLISETTRKNPGKPTFPNSFSVRLWPFLVSRNCPVFQGFCQTGREFCNTPGKTGCCKTPNPRLFPASHGSWGPEKGPKSTQGQPGKLVRSLTSVSSRPPLTCPTEINP